MALFDKLLSLKRKLDDRESRNHGRSCEISPEQVRLLLFNECDWRGRKLLFDSSAVEKVPSDKNDKPTVRQSEVPSIVEVADGFTYLYKGSSEDVKVLGEMIFGAVAMNCKNVSLKIHIMDDPRRLMCTKVFCVPNRRVSRERRERKTSAYEMSDKMTTSISKEEVSLSFAIDRGDSGFYGDQSPYSSVNSTHDYFSMFDIWDQSNMDESCSFHLPSGRKLSACSNGSWQRRTFQNIATRFDIGQSANLLGVPNVTSYAASTDSQIYSNSSTSGTNDSLASTGSAMANRKNKLGLALLITVPETAQIDVIKRCLEHSAQLQALISRLRLATLRAGASGGRVSVLYAATEHAARWLSDAMYGPRIQSAWLGMITVEPKASNKLAESLLTDLCSVLTVGDTKTTNFFISTLLTHVLTYHLGWVSTVSPYDIIDNKPHQRLIQSQKPYNALWAQLNDLCGTVGFPPRSAKTIISGPTNNFLNRLLVVLTYFLRCGDVRKNDFLYQESDRKLEAKVVNITPPSVPGLKRTATRVDKLELVDCLKVPSVNTQLSDSSSTLVTSETMKRSSTLANIALSSSEFQEGNSDWPSNQLKRKPTMMLLKPSSDSSLNSSLSETESEQKVLFVLGDNEKLVGLKNKSAHGKAVKKSSKILNEPIVKVEETKQDTRADSPSKCCGQTLQHSKPIKHSGFKFEFDKYPQIVTNYMKSKNLEILDRHYIGKPGNLKLDNFQFDPTIVPPIQEERCETCEKCQMMESLLQTPTNASEMEYMNDMPRQELQYAKEIVVQEERVQREISPKTFVRRQVENAVVVNVKSVSSEVRRQRRLNNEKLVEVSQVLEFGMPKLSRCECLPRAGFDVSLLGGVTDHYVPDLVLQGTNAKPNIWELELRRDLELASYMSKTTDAPVKTIAIVGDINSWQVRIVGREGGSNGMSSLVGAMLDTLPAMCKAKIPAQQCISFIESKLREFCVLSKTLAEMLMSTDFCDIATLTKSLNIDINDVPLLLAIATTHTPQVAHRYGLSYG